MTEKKGSAKDKEKAKKEAGKEAEKELSKNKGSGLADAEVAVMYGLVDENGEYDEDAVQASQAPAAARTRSQGRLAPCSPPLEAT